MDGVATTALAENARAKNFVGHGLSDARMLELLAPYEGQRGRVIRLLEAARIKIPRFGPRFSPGHIERL